jgi:class 3 adenylate cyclase
MIMDVRSGGPTLFERAGGFGSVSRIVMSFYVNVAARLEALAEPMEILMSGEALRGLGSSFRAESLGIRELKGAGRFEVHRLLSVDEAAHGEP